MLKRWHWGWLVWLAGVMALVQAATAAEAIRGNLVSVGWLQENLKNPEVLLFDASPTPMHMEQHIPGAVSVDLYRYGVRDASAADVEKRMQSWGISPGKKIVIYDQGGDMGATWLFYELQYRGVPSKDLLILDGGLAKWRAAGGAVTKDPTPPPAVGSFRVTRMNEDSRVRLPEFLTASGDLRNHTLVEALEPEWHYGGTAWFDRSGHVPGAIMLPARDFYNADKTFKSPEEIRRMLGYLGIKPEQQIHSYCGGGVAATVPYFALRHIAEYPRVTVFRESQLAWLRDERQLPFWTYSAPSMMRQTGWLKTWGGKTMRQYGLSDVHIVDVRPAEKFNQGHLPFAANVPAEVFRNHLGQPDKLAEALAKAGIGPAFEAVVVSDAGLDPDAALAWLMLESLGQRRTSVFTDSILKWAELGQEVAKPAANAPAPAAAARTAAQRANVLIRDPNATQGAFPKVFVASGKAPPSKSPQGKVVHLPYSDMLNADGTPKAAMEIWQILSKAGVPRYAELVFFADDPGAAAANYFIFKLMGFPDAKVLVM